MNQFQFMSEIGVSVGRTLETLTWSATGYDSRSAVVRLFIAAGVGVVAAHKGSLFLGNLALGVINEVRDEVQAA
jgi:hypothetical protein